MKLYEKYSEGGYHSSIASTFNVDFDAYETIALSRLRGADAATISCSATVGW